MPSRRLQRFVVSCLLVLLAAAAAGARQMPGPQVGDLAPDFSLQGSDGRTYTLAQFRGLRPVVIAWFPKAFAKV
jgi:peroxiredoxin Q/BCP